MCNRSKLTNNVDCLILGAPDRIGYKDTLENIRLHYPKCSFLFDKTTDNILDQNKEYVNYYYPEILYQCVSLVDALRCEGISAEYLIDADIGLLEQQFKYKQFKYIIINGNYFSSIYQYQKIIRTIRKHNSYHKIIIGGTFITNLCKNVSKREKFLLLKLIAADAFVPLYSSTDVITTIIKAWMKEGTLDGVPHVYYVKDGKYRQSASERLEQEREYAIDWSRYQEHLGPVVSLKVTQNCCFSCSFCAIKSDSEKFTLLDLNITEKELKNLDRIDKVQTIFIPDETVNYPEHHFMKYLQILCQNKFHFNWIGYVRCQFITPQIIPLLIKSKCKAVYLGIESGSNDILQNMNKGTTTTEMKYGHQLLRRSGILTCAIFIIGFPGETRETIEKTIGFINDLQPSFYILRRWDCVEGTKIWDQRHQYNIRKYNNEWIHETMSSQEADMYVDWIPSQVEGAVNITDMDTLILFQLMNDGLDYQSVKKIISKGR